MIIKIVCPLCGSDDVWRDAAAKWSVEDQKWELGADYDAMTCEDCSHESNTFAVVFAEQGRWVRGVGGSGSIGLSDEALQRANAEDAIPAPMEIKL